MKHKFIQKNYFQINQLFKNLKNFLAGKLNISDEDINKSLKCYLDSFKDDLWIYAEYPYVDKIYRDSYYTYYSSKHQRYERDSIRLSFFSNEINLSSFRNTDEIKKTEGKYLGFLIIRPTLPNLVGRTMISPLALKNNDFLCCLTSFVSLVDGLKLKCCAFPHASQDGETASCAETCIWSIMEYFGTKYHEYMPVLPSHILSSLSITSYERLLPSAGLYASQISLALKEFGFGTLIYSSDSYDKKTFKRILNYYIESGIPVVASISNDKIGHAVVLIGHDNYNRNDIHKTAPSHIINNKNAIKIIDTADIERRLVIIDDNYQPYQISNFNNPFSYYDDPDFKTCKIKNFIVPLYKKIYLDAFNARNLVTHILENEKIGYINIVKNNSAVEYELILRMFLTSSRSFKNRVLLNKSMNEEMKDFLILSSMPKFIWVAELSNKKLYLQNKALGIIIINATGNELFNSVNSIIYPNKLIINNKEDKTIIISKDWGFFHIYQNNLKGEWSKWQTH